MTEHEKIEEMIRQKEQAPIALDPRTDCARHRRCSALLYPARLGVCPGLRRRLAPGALDGYFRRVKSVVLPRIQELQRCFRSLAPAGDLLHLRFRMHEGGEDLPGWLKDFDKLGLELLGRRPNPVVNGGSWQIDEAIARFPVKSSSTNFAAVL